MKRECDRERKVRLVTTQVHSPAWTTTRRGFRRHSPSDARHASSDVVVWIHRREAELSPTQHNYDDTEHACGRQRDKRHRACCDRQTTTSESVLAQVSLVGRRTVERHLASRHKIVMLSKIKAITSMAVNQTKGKGKYRQQLRERESDNTHTHTHTHTHTLIVCFRSRS